MLEGMNDLLRVFRRIAITIVGAVILALGVVLLVAPGPGLLVIALALVVFAVEYEWARRRLATVQARARSAAHRAAASRAATAAALLFGIGTVGLGSLLIFTDLLPLSGAGAGIGVVIAGLTVLATMGYGMREFRRARLVAEDDVARPPAGPVSPGTGPDRPARDQDDPGGAPESPEPLRRAPGRPGHGAT
ncbi:MAG: PGPGW domain-containing protein [Streptosporangiaceae bacterium]